MGRALLRVIVLNTRLSISDNIIMFYHEQTHTVPSNQNGENTSSSLPLKLSTKSDLATHYRSKARIEEPPQELGNISTVIKRTEKAEVEMDQL